MRGWLVLAVALVPAAASAQTTPPTPVQPQQAQPVQPQQPTLTAQETLTWPARYERARQFLLDGEFDKAVPALDELVAVAPTPEDARAARELAEVARYWLKRDLVFIPRRSLGESTLGANAVDRRTVDELVTLYITATAYGAGLGASLAFLANGDGAAPYIIPMIAGAGLGIGGVALADTFGRLHYGQPQSISTGVFLGLGGGLLFDAWHGANTSGSGGDKSKLYVGIGIATTTLGGVVGGALGSLVPITPGRASWVSSVALWGGGLVGCITGAVAAKEIEEGVLIAGMAGYGAGIVGGALTAGLVSPSIARVRLLDLGGLLGGFTVGGLYAAAADASASGDPNVALALVGVGIAAGLTTSWLLTMGMHPDRPNEVKETTVSLHPTLAPLPGGGTIGLGGTW